MLSEKTIGFIGGGQMAQAIFGGVLSANVAKAENITVTDINADLLNFLKENYGVNVKENVNGAGAEYIAENCDVIFIAVKPQYAAEALAPIKNKISADKTVISIMGGVTLAKLGDMLGECSVIRVMPNLPMKVKKGVAGITAGVLANNNDKLLAKEIFECVGEVFELPESLITPLTGISGCGPAFAYMFIEALADGGVQMGLSRDMSIKLAAQTLLGSAEMVMQTGEHPDKLKDNVCSPAGGTIAGVHSLEQASFRGAVAEAVIKSCERMDEVGKKA